MARSPDNLPYLTWRDLHWWEKEKARPKGARHAKRFNPNLDVDRWIVNVAGFDCKQLATDR